MNIEITKSENGFHCKDEDGKDWCFDTKDKLMEYLFSCMPSEAGEEVKLTD